MRITRMQEKKKCIGRSPSEQQATIIYDAMAEAIRTGRPYQTRLDPPPGPPTDAEGNFLPVTHWDLANWPPHIHLPRSEDPAP